MIDFKRYTFRLGAIALAISGFMGSAQAATIKTDIVFVADTSASMSGYLSGLQSAIGAITTAFGGFDVDVQYGFVAFGEGYF